MKVENFFPGRAEPHGHHIAVEARVDPAADLAGRVHRRGLRPLRLRAGIPRQEWRHPLRAVDSPARTSQLLFWSEFRQHVGIVRRGFHRRRAVGRHRDLEQLPRLSAFQIPVRRRRRGSRPPRAMGASAAAAHALLVFGVCRRSRRNASARNAAIRQGLASRSLGRGRARLARALRLGSTAGERARPRGDSDARLRRPVQSTLRRLPGRTLERRSRVPARAGFRRLRTSPLMATRPGVEERGGAGAFGAGTAQARVAGGGARDLPDRVSARHVARVARASSATSTATRRTNGTGVATTPTSASMRWCSSTRRRRQTSTTPLPSSDAAEAQGHEVEIIRLKPTELAKRPDGSLILPNERFGFADGVSQPVIRGAPRKNMRALENDLVAPGEIVLGYPDNIGTLPPSPSLADKHDPQHYLPDKGPDPFRRRPSSRATRRRPASAISAPTARSWSCASWSNSTMSFEQVARRRISPVAARSERADSSSDGESSIEIKAKSVAGLAADGGAPSAAGTPWRRERRADHDAA